MRNIRFIFFCLLASVLLLSNNAQTTNEARTFHYYEQCDVFYEPVHWLKSFAFVDGDYLGFEYTTDNAAEVGNASVAESKIVFLVNPDSDEFNLKDEEIGEHTGLYMQRCRCADRGVHTIQKGTITGRKLEDGNWNVNIDVSFKGLNTGKDYQIVVNGIYTLASK